MTQEQQMDDLIRCLLAERKEYQDIGVPSKLPDKRRLLRSLMNVRPPAPVSKEFLRAQDAYLQERLVQRGVTRLQDLTPVRPGLYLWQGDITTLAVDAIVNAANSGMTGCYIPCHGCIDNAIHTYAGIQLRLECARIMAGQRGEEPVGQAKITKAYNLPCRYVLHTVGPMIEGAVTKTDREQLSSCYRSCLDLAAANGLHSVAFCCISTGEFHFPNELAAQIAIETVRDWQRQNPDKIEVIFNVFKDSDRELYKRLLG
ncbi:protein-ADP-ribose hydrolase [uncultured Oscillibacter sp.]|uniref:protein-ADP-ribose hydrolase n=1 Tax=uncultured Oscillibacter sp. TaxID=876091 RepID=UPI00280B27BC|nr:protein-ADP-ribose hydrolase [uncultured Oscillibacter sp.]